MCLFEYYDIELTF